MVEEVRERALKIIGGLEIKKGIKRMVVNKSKRNCNILPSLSSVPDPNLE